jgi:competence protein ComEA
MKWLRDYFSLSKREEKGILVLVVIIVLLFGLQYAWIYIIPKSKNFSPGIELTSMQLKKQALDSSNDDNHSLHPFQFDPNTLDEKGFVSLGLPENIAAHIIHYREKGGHFGKPEDFKKIYGLSDSDYVILKPWITIKSKEKEAREPLVDLNTADSLHLLSVKGIGPVFANRILTLRHRLGGFISKEQLMDVYGLDQEKYDFIKNQVFLSKVHIVKTNINTATVDELKKNPYIRYKLAVVIVNYRIAHGDFKTIDELKNIQAIDKSTYSKIMPYVEVK